MSGIFVVIGARRGLGLEVVRRLLELPMNQVKEVRAVCRPSNAITTELKDPSDVRIKLVQIDGCNAEALRESQVLAGAECVFFCASASSTLKNYKDVDQEGPKVVAAAALEAKVPKMVLVTSQLVDPVNKWHWVRLCLNNVASFGIMDCKFQGEQYLRASGQPYVIIRPGHLIDGPLGTGIMRVGQTNGHFLSGHRNARADVAALCLAAARSPNCLNVTFECAAEQPADTSSGAPPIDPTVIFATLQSAWDVATFAPAQK